ncbi:MAG: class I SAM-dependent methyltransferase [Alphaproteobacteria bacterium]
MTPLLTGLMRRLIRRGRLKLITAGGRTFNIGDPGSPPVTIRLHDWRVSWDLLRNPQLKLGEAYMDGRLTVEQGDIADLLDLLTRNLGTGFGGGYLDWLARARFVLGHLAPSNRRGRSRRNVAHHYDLSGDLYRLFLDADRQYSCAFFERFDDTLEVAQSNKKKRIAAKLALRRGMRVLDIGSGWGGLGLYLAETHGAEVRGITLSGEQLDLARARAAGAGLVSRVHFSLEDYRETTGRFDRIVSVGMLEHVGVGNYDTYFRKIAALLADDGVALVHSIGRSDGPGVTNPWIEKYIFPGGYSPALSEVLPAVERAGLIVTDIEILRLHYAQTLKEWRRRFVANRDAARALYDERFCRMWEFYLAGAEMAFRWQGHVVFQLQVAKRLDALPFARDYMTPKPAPLSQASIAAVAASGSASCDAPAGRLATAVGRLMPS